MKSLIISLAALVVLCIGCGNGSTPQTNIAQAGNPVTTEKAPSSNSAAHALLGLISELPENVVITYAMAAADARILRELEDNELAGCTIPLDIEGERWYLQASGYGYDTIVKCSLVLSGDQIEIRKHVDSPEKKYDWGGVVIKRGI